MERHDQHKRRLNALTALAFLGVWLVLAAGGMTWVDPGSATLVWALLALTATLAVTRPFRYAGWVVAGLCCALYVGVQMTLWGPAVDALTNAGVGVASLLGTAFLGDITAQQLTSVIHQLARDRERIHELSIHDPGTGLIKWHYARQDLKSEVVRSLRYQADLGLLFIRVAGWDELTQKRGAANANAVMAEISEIMVDTLRVVDIPTRFNDVTLGAILPETPAEGARLAAQRLIDAVTRRVHATLHIGAAHFPGDATTDDELIHAAEAALQSAITSNQPIVSHNQLRSAAEAAAEKGVAEKPYGELDRAPTESQAGRETPSTVQPEILHFPGPRPKAAEEGRETSKARQSIQETRVRIVGLRQVTKVHDIRKILNAHPVIEGVSLIQYTESTVALLIKHRSASLLDVLRELLDLSVQEVRQVDGWIEVDVDDADIDASATA